MTRKINFDAPVPMASRNVSRYVPITAHPHVREGVRVLPRNYPNTVPGLRLS